MCKKDRVLVVGELIFKFLKAGANKHPTIKESLLKIENGHVSVIVFVLDFFVSNYSSQKRGKKWCR